MDNHSSFFKGKLLIINTLVLILLVHANGFICYDSIVPIKVTAVISNIKKNSTDSMSSQLFILVLNNPPVNLKVKPKVNAPVMLTFPHCTGKLSVLNQELNHDQLKSNGH